MDKGRFSLLLLEPGEIYFEDYSAVLISDCTRENFDTKKQIGRLKLCSKSIVFDPKDIKLPLIKIPFKECTLIEQWKGRIKFLKENNILSIQCKQYSEMLEGNVIAPYKFCESGKYLFLLNYAKVADCLPQMCQLYRASTLAAADQADMIATIVHSRHARVKFDPLWLDLYEKVVMETQADKVNPLVVNPGRILLTTSRLYFQPYNNIEPYPVLKVKLEDIKRIIRRRFLLRHVGMEIYLQENGVVSHIYLALKTTSERDALYSNLLAQPVLKLCDIEQGTMTLQWQNGIVSNYDYLLYINSLADRTVNDLTQYPVFPWVISDYASNDLDLSDSENYRDLSKPVGALNELRLQRLMERYEEMSHPKFIYGSHYSTPGFVLFYLVRLYPHYMLCLQNGRFDHPDRMFNSVSDVYRNCLNNMSDFKELIPEFYDTESEGSFLVNNMGIDFGYRHDGTKVNDVQLPKWAASTEDFVKKLRDALESDYVSQNLHKWIDLIFGYKQRGDEAEKAKNLFYYLCYEGSVDLDSITDLNKRHALEVQIMEFGQIPKQVFTVPHPQRHPTSIPANITNKQDCENPPELVKWKNVNVLHLVTSFGTHKDAISFLTVTDDSKIISVGHDSLLKVFSLEYNRQIRSVNIGSMTLSSCVRLPDKNILVVGSWDNNIVLYDLEFGRISQNLLAHEDAVSCLCWGSESNLLASGSWDCTIRIWKGFLRNEVIKLAQCLVARLDHDSHVLCAAFNPKNTCLASGTKDGDIVLWDMETFTVKKVVKGHTGGARSVHFSPDGQKLVSCGADSAFQIVDISTGMALFNKTLSGPLNCLAWDDFTVFLGSEDGYLYIWDIQEVKLLYKEKAHNDAINTLSVSSKNNVIATGGNDRCIKVWKP